MPLCLPRGTSAEQALRRCRGVVRGVGVGGWEEGAAGGVSACPKLTRRRCEGWHPPLLARQAQGQVCLFVAPSTCCWSSYQAGWMRREPPTCRPRLGPTCSCAVLP